MKSNQSFTAALVAICSFLFVGLPSGFAQGPPPLPGSTPPPLPGSVPPPLPLPDFYVAKNGGRVGPLPGVEFERMLRTGEVTGETLVWTEGMKAWEKAAKVPALASRLSKPAHPAAPAEIRVIDSRSLIEAFAAVRGNRGLGRPVEIVLADGIYEIRSELELVDAGAVTIRAEKYRASILSSDMEDAVISIKGCKSVHLENLTLKHAPPVQDNPCTGMVVYALESEMVSLGDCSLDGCGTWAVLGERVTDLSVSGGSITNCSYGVFQMFQCGNVVVEGVSIFKNYQSEPDLDWVSMIYLSECGRFDFNQNDVVSNGNARFGKTDRGSVLNLSGNRFRDNLFPEPLQR